MLGLGFRKGLADGRPLPDYTVEFESCYRGKIEIRRSIRTGKIIYQKIIR